MKVRLLAQPSLMISPAWHSTGTWPSQISDAIKLSLQIGGIGLHPSSPPVGRGGSTGAAVSTTVTSWVATTMLSQLSAAVHTRVRMAGQTPLVVSSNATGTSPMQSSMAVTSAGGGTWSHSTVTSPGTPSSTGAVVSTTVICCVQTTVLSQSSVACQIRRRV